MDYSVIVTSRDEPVTVGRLIRQIETQLSQIDRKTEVLLVCPDKKTKESAISQDKLRIVKWLKDKSQGKPAALNIAFKKAKGRVLILTDGDVGLEDGALEELTNSFYLSSRPKRRDPPFPKRDSSTVARNDRELGLVTGRPVPVNNRDDLFGFWAHFLTEAAHHKRNSRHKAGSYLDGSGYLMAVKKELINQMPENILVDDAWISRQVWNQGYKTGYASKAKVKVKFPTNLSDWVTQKKRTISGYVQLADIVDEAIAGNADSPFCEAGLRSLPGMRSFWQESFGLRFALTYPRNFKEYIWMLLLIFARLYVWLAVFWDRKILKKPYSGNWKRIESTK